MELDVDMTVLSLTVIAPVWIVDVTLIVKTSIFEPRFVKKLILIKLSENTFTRKIKGSISDNSFFLDITLFINNDACCTITCHFPTHSYTLIIRLVFRVNIELISITFSILSTRILALFNSSAICVFLCDFSQSTIIYICTVALFWCECAVNIW